MSSATAAPTHHSHFDWGGLWALLGGVGGAAAVIVLLLTYLPDLFVPIRVTYAVYQVAHDRTMAITITVKNRRRGEQLLTGLIIGQPPSRWRRLWPRRWWRGLRGPKLFDLEVDLETLGPIPSGASKQLGPLPLRPLGDTTLNDRLPSNVRVLAYCGAGRPYVAAPRGL